MKGIILAGGRATRLYPITKGISKQLLPVYDKPMVYYPLSVLMLAGIRDILVISTSQALPQFQALLGDGSELGLRIQYAAQDQPKGIADAFLVGESFIGRDSVCLVLGDNIFFGDRLAGVVQEAAKLTEGAVIFGYHVTDPERYGVIELDAQQRVRSIEEKPAKPKSNWAVTGLYCYDHQVVQIAKSLKPSARGELEITDVNNRYLAQGQLRMVPLGRGFAWLDTGTYNSLIDAAQFIRTLEERQGLKVGCIEEIAFRMGYIDRRRMDALIAQVPASYAEYLRGVMAEPPAS